MAAEFRVAEFILDGLIAEDLITGYDLTLAPDGSATVVAYFTEGASKVERRSLLGPLEAAFDTARSLLGNPTDWS